MKRSNIELKSTHGVREIRDTLSPEWLRDCVMVDDKNKAIVIAPTEALKHGYTNLFVTQNRFGSKDIIKVKLDFDLVRVPKETLSVANESTEKKQ
jgi:hypothetical protein